MQICNFLLYFDIFDICVYICIYIFDVISMWLKFIQNSMFFHDFLIVFRYIFETCSMLLNFDIYIQGLFATINGCSIVFRFSLDTCLIVSNYLMLFRLSSNIYIEFFMSSPMFVKISPNQPRFVIFQFQNTFLASEKLENMNIRYTSRFSQMNSYPVGEEDNKANLKA